MPILQSDWQHRLNETSLVLLRCTCGIINFFFTFFTSQSSNNAEKDEHSYEFLKMYHLPEVNAAVKEQNRATRVAVEAIKYTETEGFLILLILEWRSNYS